MQTFPDEQKQLFDTAWALSRSIHGNTLSVHVPGMFVVNGRRGRYKAISITGEKCELACEHCKGSLLRTMPHAVTPDALVKRGKEAYERGDYGILVTGGCDASGRLPWKEFLPAMKRLKTETNLVVTVHAGQVDINTALELKEAGVDQALVDVIGDDSTAKQVYHLENGISTIAKTMDCLSSAGLEIVPHILFGLHYGRRKGEDHALQMLKNYDLDKYVLVVIMPASGTPMAHIEPPTPLEAAFFLAEARLELPKLKASLGCARPRGKYRRELDVLAVSAGVNSIALPSDQGMREAENRNLDIIYSETCCSLGERFAGGEPS